MPCLMCCWRTRGFGFFFIFFGGWGYVKPLIAELGIWILVHKEEKVSYAYGFSMWAMVAVVYGSWPSSKSTSLVDCSLDPEALIWMLGLCRVVWSFCLSLSLCLCAIVTCHIITSLWYVFIFIFLRLVGWDCLYWICWPYSNYIYFEGKSQCLYMAEYEVWVFIQQVILLLNYQ